jgi:hypothetical protein
VSKQLRDDGGWALVTTVLVMGILMSIALPLMTLVDTQQAGTSAERKSEGSFNVADAALNASVFILADDWPAASSTEYPRSCSATSSATRCPDSALITGTYTGGDYTDLGWRVRVRDDTGSEYYDPAAVASRPRWDANRNGKMWVRADGRSSGNWRSVVALVRTVEQVESFPRRVVTAGWFETTNNGNKVIIDTRGRAAEPAPLAVRCTQKAPSSCLNYNPAKGQVTPETVETGYSGTTAVSPAVLSAYRERAKSLGTYYATGCPSSPSGSFVFVENGDCTYTGGGQANSASSPGMFIVARGTLTLGGNFEFYGLVYAANLQRSTGMVVSLKGTSEIIGSVAVDGGGGVSAGSSGRNITFGDLTFADISSTRSIAVVHGTWREVNADTAGGGRGDGDDDD